ncbi:hypothetical protein [Candidatus Protochlamydia phocaeensis]|uniref:hypothetical protein n=1 Tax=Candidatus Protochlamydia phocaeensis TaxID=1414722 RepID=UPI0008390F9B|nr:hypothetical protein [Candidatus Protochlamydia phocaeensis]
MKDPNNDLPLNNSKLKIGFPTSTEDRRLQLVDINGSIFAIVYSPLESNGPIRLECEDWSLILLAPIKSKTDIVISAINIIRFNTIESEEGVVNISASNQLVNFASPMTSLAYETGERGAFQFEDPAALFNYSQLFNKVVAFARGENLDSSFSEAQKNFMMGLCAIAKKMEPNTEDLNLPRVFGIWDISWSND